MRLIDDEAVKKAFNKLYEETLEYEPIPFEDVVKAIDNIPTAEIVLKECPVCYKSFAYTDVCPVCNAELRCNHD